MTSNTSNSAGSKEKKRIIVFTLFYPYLVNNYSYDSYFEEELRILETNFDEIIILSQAKESSDTQYMPKNAKAFSVNSDRGKVQPALIWRLGLLKELGFIISNVNLIHWFSAFKSLVKSHLKVFSYLSFLEKINFSKNEIQNTYLYSYWINEGALALCLLKEKKKFKKVISRAHSLDIYFERSRNGYLPLKLTTSQKLDKIAFISDQGKNYWNDFLKRQGLPFTDKTCTSRLGINNHVEPNFNRINSNLLFIVTNCWLQPLKRIDLFIKSISRIKNIPIRWVHIGDDYNTGYEKYIQEMCVKYLTSNNNIEISFKGRMNNKEVFQFYMDNTVDLIVNSSITEGIPVSIMEAFSFAIPAIATDVGGVSEIVIDNDNGILLQKDIVEEDLESAIIKYYNLPTSEKRKIKINAYNTWKNKYNATSNYSKFIDEVVLDKNVIP